MSDNELISLISDAIETHIQWACEKNEGNIQSDSIAHTVVQVLEDKGIITKLKNTGTTPINQWH
jgi:hypothetical protein